MVRLGVFFVWIGAESKRDTFEKNSGRDLRALVKKMRDNGICVLVSGILFLEHHTPENIQEDIDYIIDLKGDFTQFMMFTPLPGTRLYRTYHEQGRIDFGLPFEEWHGQKYLNYDHPTFGREEARRILDEAFQAEFDRLSSSPYRMTETALRGYVNTAQQAEADPWIAIRRQQMLARGQELRMVIPTMARFAHNPLERERALALEQRFCREVGPMTPKMRAASVAARLIAEAHSVRRRFFRDMAQPRARVTRLRWAAMPQTSAETPPLIPRKVSLPVHA